ncbi:dynactin subunit 1 [Anaeramoeba ignava]|uniref:Dynactin subunit 1 n=1 Tax=Anaeramoeba ignava TaxID=1746090 RepID=A0A9Q0RHU7_ANAIG|nr:dynactin subunit 1 [Anaeramoeba ignava]
MIGIELSKPNGDSNGTLNGISYFSTQPLHGIFVPISDITLLKKRTASPQKEKDSNQKITIKKNEKTQLKDNQVKKKEGVPKPKVKTQKENLSKTVSKTKTQSKVVKKVVKRTSPVQKPTKIESKTRTPVKNLKTVVSNQKSETKPKQKPKPKQNPKTKQTQLAKKEEPKPIQKKKSKQKEEVDVTKLPLDQQIAFYQSKIDHMSIKIEEIEFENEETKNKTEEAQLKIEELEIEKSEIEDGIEFSSEAIQSRLAEKRFDFQKEKTEIEKEISFLLLQNKKLKENLITKNQSLAEMKKNGEKMENEIEKKTQEVEKKQSEITQLEETVQEIEDQNSELQALAKESQDYGNVLTEMRSKNEMQSKKIEELKSTVVDLRELHKLTQQVDMEQTEVQESIRNEIEENERKTQQQQNQTKELNEKIGLLKTQLDNYRKNSQKLQETNQKLKEIDLAQKNILEFSSSIEDQVKKKRAKNEELKKRGVILRMENEAKKAEYEQVIMKNKFFEKALTPQILDNIKKSFSTELFTHRMVRKISVLEKYIETMFPAKAIIAKITETNENETDKPNKMEGDSLEEISLKTLFSSGLEFQHLEFFSRLKKFLSVTSFQIEKLSELNLKSDQQVFSSLNQAYSVFMKFESKIDNLIFLFKSKEITSNLDLSSFENALSPIKSMLENYLPDSSLSSTKRITKTLTIFYFNIAVFVSYTERVISGFTSFSQIRSSLDPTTSDAINLKSGLSIQETQLFELLKYLQKLNSKLLIVVERILKEIENENSQFAFKEENEENIQKHLQILENSIQNIKKFTKKFNKFLGVSIPTQFLSETKINLFIALLTSNPNIANITSIYELSENSKIMDNLLYLNTEMQTFEEKLPSLILIENENENENQNQNQNQNQIENEKQQIKKSPLSQFLEETKHIIELDLQTSHLLELELKKNDENRNSIKENNENIQKLNIQNKEISLKVSQLSNLLSNQMKFESQIKTLQKQSEEVKKDIEDLKSKNDLIHEEMKKQFGDSFLKFLENETTISVDFLVSETDAMNSALKYSKQMNIFLKLHNSHLQAKMLRNTLNNIPIMDFVLTYSEKSDQSINKFLIHEKKQMKENYLKGCSLGKARYLLDNYRKSQVSRKIVDLSIPNPSIFLTFQKRNLESKKNIFEEQMKIILKNTFSKEI